jgi:hypothetical protein
MSATTGPVLAAGAITVANAVVFNDAEMDWRIPVATTLLAGGFYLLERAAGDVAEVLAWTLVVTTLFTRVDPNVPSPVESAVTWWDSNQKGSGPSVRAA